MIRPYESQDFPAVAEIWNAAVRAGEVVYEPLTERYFQEKFERDPNYDPRYSLVAEEGGRVVAFVNGVAKKVLLPGETSENTPGYLTCIFVAADCRGRGVGAALLCALENAFRDDGKRAVVCSGSNPVNLDWRIPGTPGHDHNNAPGADVEGAGYGFLLAMGYADLVREVAMYLNLADYVPWEGLEAKRAELAAQGVFVGRYDASLGYDYDGMCDRVHSEYWRSVLRSEIACHQSGLPNTDPRFIPNGKVPAGPRPIMVATCDGKIVAQAGPVDRQQSGRGWFTGICTDPLYERRGIASVLFDALLREFIAQGATFSTLFTGESNHAQRIYLRAGFRVARRFAVMKKEL